MKVLIACEESQTVCKYQEQLDKALQEAYKGNGEKFYKFRDRYDCLREYDYKEGRWKGR